MNEEDNSPHFHNSIDNNYLDLEIDKETDNLDLNSTYKEKYAHLKDPNYVPPEHAALPLVIFENGKFIIPNETKKLLFNLKYSNIGIISLVGKYRTGKSFLLNRVLLNTIKENGFEVGPTFKPCTKGIWMWSDPIIINNSFSPKEFPVFFIDTEGLGAYDEEVNHDSKIFLIAILISSLFIFNSFGAIDEQAISNLSFVLNLSKIIKFKNNIRFDENEKIFENFCPSFLWLLRDFSLRLEDKDGNPITQKQYLESALKNLAGSSEMIVEKNRIRTLIKNFFKDRDCFTMIRPVENEGDLQNMQHLENKFFRKEFLDECKQLKKRIFETTKPKQFFGKNIKAIMLIELIENILDSINQGNIPVIENSWKYVLTNEAIKNSEDIVNKFAKEIENYRNLNKDNKNFYDDVQKFSKKLSDNYLNEFLNNEYFDDDIKKQFTNKLRSKLDNELVRFNKENEKIFQEQFNNNLNNLSDEFIANNLTNNITENFNDFEMEIENFLTNCNKIKIDFKNKNELILDKILLFFRKFYDYHKNKTNKQIQNLENENFNLQKQLNENINQKNINENIDQLKNFFKDNLNKYSAENSSFLKEIFSEKLKDEKDEMLNLTTLNEKNGNLIKKITELENENKNLLENNTELILYKNIIDSMDTFKCKKCQKNFNYDEFKDHYENCNNIVLQKNIKFNPDKLKIKIVKGKIKIDEIGKPFLEYIIDITYNNQSWRINKKFNQFANLFKNIQNYTNNLPESSKIFLNFNEKNFSNNFHENKIIQLEKFIKDLSQIDEINNSKVFLRFIEFENNYFIDDEEINNNNYNYNNNTNYMENYNNNSNYNYINENYNNNNNNNNFNYDYNNNYNNDYNNYENNYENKISENYNNDNSNNLLISNNNYINYNLNDESN